MLGFGHASLRCARVAAPNGDVRECRQTPSGAGGLAERAANRERFGERAIGVIEARKLTERESEVQETRPGAGAIAERALGVQRLFERVARFLEPAAIERHHPAIVMQTRHFFGVVDGAGRQRGGRATERGIGSAPVGAVKRDRAERGERERAGGRIVLSVGEREGLFRGVARSVGVAAPRELFRTPSQREHAQVGIPACGFAEPTDQLRVQPGAAATTRRAIERGQNFGAPRLGIGREREQRFGFLAAKSLGPRPFGGAAQQIFATSRRMGPVRNREQRLRPRRQPAVEEHVGELIDQIEIGERFGQILRERQVRDHPDAVTVGAGA